MRVKRDIFEEIYQEFDQNEICILMGPRQVGKSTLMIQIQEKIKTKSVFFDLEDPLTLAEFNLDTAGLIQKLKNTNAKVIFIDEFHYLENASKIFKSIFDNGARNPKEKIKIYASGSSSIEMHKHLKESLAGRKNTYQIFPLAFLEIKRAMKNFSFEEYILYGALPGLIHKTTRDQKIKLLESLLKTYIEIDIKSLVKEENLSGFNNLLKLLAFNQGQLVEVSNLASEIKCSSPTAQRYLDILEQTFVLYSLQSFSKNLSNELKKSKKYYFYDLGIRNILIKDFKQLDNRKDKGTIYESYVNNFLRSRLKANMSLNFWRTKQQEEIDFILLIDHIPFPIEVKSQLKRPEIPSAFLSFNKHYPDAKDFFLINENIETTIDCGSFQVHFVRIAELEQNELINSILTNP